MEGREGAVHSTTVLPFTPGWLFLGQKMLAGKEASQVCAEGSEGCPSAFQQG